MYKVSEDQHIQVLSKGIIEWVGEIFWTSFESQEESC